MSEVTYELIDTEAPAEIDSTLTPGPPSAETVGKMETALSQMKMLRKALASAERAADPYKVKANRKKKNRRHDALAKASRKRNR